MRAPLAIFLLLLPLAACAGKTPPLDACAANAMCAARRAEPQLLVPEHSMRHGNDLVLLPLHGEKLIFTDNGKACEDADIEHCVGYALVGFSIPAHAFVVEIFYYEGGDFLLLDSGSGRKTPLNGLPVFSPDGAEFLVAPYDDETDSGPNNLEIWRRDGDGAVLEWAHPFKQAFAEDPSLEQLYQVAVSGWDGNRIRLVLTEPGTSRRWTGSIIRDAQGWHLFAKSPPDLRQSGPR
jgi:hypothetical protein